MAETKKAQKKLRIMNPLQALAFEFFRPSNVRALLHQHRQYLNAPSYQGKGESA